jgi:predicted component of type VI protein secretion system
LEWLDQQLEQDLRETQLPNASEREQAQTVGGVLAEALTALTQAVTELKTRYPDDPPTFGRIRRILELLRAGLGETGASSTEATGTAGTGAAPGSTGPTSGPRSRAEALRMLEQVAAYFDASEPLSPVPHLLRRAQRWARGSLQQWLTEMVDKDDQLESIYKTLDMSKPAAKE